ncbi:MAG: histidine phosphatase family protein [Myxococcales bacterium]|nr:histidine phosphatase family protein [Myxococcales bacterium]
MTIYLVRHGETRWNVVRRVQGRTNSPLTLRGLEQIAAYAKLLKAELGTLDDVALCASPLARTQQTASTIDETLPQPDALCSETERLAERYCGDWEGLLFEQLLERYGESVRFEWRRWDNRVGGDGESLDDVQARARAWLAEPRPAARTIVVTHGIMSRQFRGAYLGLPPEDVMKLESHTHDRIFKLEDGAVGIVEVPDVEALPASRYSMRRS